MNRSDFMMILLLLLVFSHANCGKSKDEKFVESTVYTEESFIANVPNAKHFVMFYAPWCGHCQRLKPVWDALTNSVSAEMSLDVVLAKVDCTVETKLCSDEGVIGYPTLKLYTPEKDSIRYKGARDLSALYKFVKTALTSAPETDSLVEPKDGLYELTKDSFDKHISSGFHFIMFYAPWCGHCKRLEPVWLELAKLHSSSDEIPDDVKISRVDCTENRAVCTEFDVRGYPTLLWFQDGNMIKKYQSIRELEYFEKFIEEMKNSDDEDDDEASEISHKEGLHELTQQNFKRHVSKGHHFIMFYAPWCGHCRRLEPVWLDLAKSYIPSDETPDAVKISRRYTFRTSSKNDTNRSLEFFSLDPRDVADSSNTWTINSFSEFEHPRTIGDKTRDAVDCTEHRDVCSKFEVRGYPTLLWFEDGKMVKKYQNSRDMESFEEFIEEMKNSDDEDDDEASEISHNEGLHELTQQNFKRHISKGHHFIMFYAPWCGHCRRLEPVWLDLAKSYIPSDETPDAVKISRVDCTEHRDVCSKFEVRGYPTLLWFQDGKMVKKYQGGRNNEDLERFIQDMENPGDEDDDEASEISHKEGLHELTQQNFKRHITKGHHFIMFYAPWCGHCRRLEPVWLDLAKSYIPSDETPDAVKISRIDCTAHGDVCTDHNVRGYPTLLWFENGNFMRKYQKSRRLEDLEMFVKEMMGLPVEREDASPQKSKPPPTPSPVFTEEEEEKDEGPVVQLNSNNFDFSVALDVTFVMFYTPWCTFCQRLAPTWEELAVEDFSELVEPVKIGRVDCTENSDLCRSHEVNGYPTLLLFKDGEVVAKYSGNRSTADLKSFVVTRIAQEKASAHKDEL